MGWLGMGSYVGRFEQAIQDFTGCRIADRYTLVKLLRESSKGAVYEASDERTSASDYTVVDTLDTEYKPNESESPYALDIGSPVPAHGSLPRVNTTAQTGPNQGALLIFPVSDDVSDNRPLKLEIHTLEGDGDVILDI